MMTLTLRILLVVLTILYISYLNTQINSQDKSTSATNVIEDEMKQRREQVAKTCKKYGSRLKIPLKLYNKKLRFDVKHRIMYCENYKIGSSTWATHLLKMNNVPIYRKTPIHIVSRQHFPPLLGRKKEAFLKKAESFIVARDPFERLLSSFKDKLNVTIRPNLVTWYSFGQVQRTIKSKYRETERPGTVPTFREFVKYLVGELSPSSRNMKKMTRMINEHWKPVYLNCAPCSERYSTIMKMETFARDNQYLKEKLNLKINVDFTRRGGREGHTDIDTTVEAFREVGPALVRRLYKIYKYDFELFGYSPEKYLNIHR